MWRVRRRRLAMALPLLALSGCMFRDLDRNLRQFNRNGFLVGAVHIAASDGEPESAPIVAFAYRGDGADAEVVDWFMLARPGPYFLVAPVGRYRVAAFEDRNRSYTYDPGEPAALLRDGAVIESRPGEVTRGLDMVLRRDAATPLPVSIALPIGSEPGVDALPNPRLGEVVGLDDPRFSAAAAATGLWRPVDFLFDVGAGIYFLEPYDPHRIPVLFVHGALGEPNDFRTLIAQLDRQRFQPWVVYYPSAVRLEIIAAELDRWLQTLELTYGFDRLAVVAHSMGGLVARAYLGRDPNIGGTREPLLFVSISTPWQGHAGAAFGVDRAPVVAPSWYDVTPGSPFLSSLLHKPLPARVSFDLFFSYGGGSRLQGEANDGVVTLASQLDPRAQDQARRVLGFDASHRGVLDSPLAALQLARALDAFAAGAAAR